MKRKVIIIIAVAAVIAAVFFYFGRNEEIPFFKETSLFSAVPVSVPMFVELNSLKSLPLDNPALRQWLEIVKVSRFTKWVQKLDSIIKDDGKIQNGLRTDPFILALGSMGGGSLTPLVIQKAESNSRKKSLNTLARAMFPEPEHTFTEIDYTGYKITSAISANNKSQLYYCFTSDLFIASSNLVLVQQSLLQLTESGLTTITDFNRLTKSLDSEPDVAWYLNQRLFPDIILEWINSSSIAEENEFKQEVKRNHYRNVQGFKKFASWNFMEAKFDDENILLKGHTVANDTANNFLSVFNGQEPRKSGAADILPMSTAFFASYTISNKRNFFENLEKYFFLAGSFYKREDLIKKMEADFKTDLRKALQSIVKNEMIVAITSIPAEPAKKTTFFILETESKSKTASQLDTMLNNYAIRKNQSIDEFKTEYSVNEKTKYTIIRFPYPSLPGIWLGNPFTAAQANYAVQFQDYLIFCNTESGLQNYLLNIIEEGSLADDSRYENATAITENRSNISAYLNVSRSLNLTNEIFNTDVAKKLEKKKAIVRKFQAVKWQVSGSDKVFTTEINLLFDDGNPDNDVNESSPGASPEMGDAQTLWQCSIGNTLITKPVITVNHSDKENREVMVQDKANNLHQIDAGGNIRWSIKVGEPILSEIFQIDYLANGKLQYLFSTKNKLFIIDRNGVNLENFPVEFPAPATNGVNVFDYENNRVYRYFVACNDNKIYGYSKEGKLMDGWKFEGTKTTVTTPVQHFKVGGKDYIVFKDKYLIYIQNRKGEPVAKTAAEFENSRSPLMLSSYGTPRLVATDTKGKIYFIGFDGNYQELNPAKFGSDHFFTTDDINGDNKPEFIFVDGKELTVFDEVGKLLFTYKFANNIQFAPSVFKFGPKEKKIGVVDSKASRIYLFNATGQLYSGFPLQGNTPFSIGKTAQRSKKLNLITGSKGGNLYNYVLD